MREEHKNEPANHCYACQGSGTQQETADDGEQDTYGCSDCLCTGKRDATKGAASWAIQPECVGCPACEGLGYIRDFWDPPGHEDTCLGCSGKGEVTPASAVEIRRVMKEHGYV